MSLIDPLSASEFDPDFTAELDAVSALAIQAPAALQCYLMGLPKVLTAVGEYVRRLEEQAGNGEQAADLVAGLRKYAALADRYALACL